MTNEQQIVTRDVAILEKVVSEGDLAALSPADRVAYYAKVCDSLGLNPYTRPFEYIKLNNKLTLYARRDATDQLRSLKRVSVQITSREVTEGVYVVTAKAQMFDRTDEAIGAVAIEGLKGEFRANAMMKAETKAKRRVTLSIVGLGWLDETEISDIPKGDKEIVEVNVTTGEIKQKPPPVAQEGQGGMPMPKETPKPASPQRKASSGRPEFKRAADLFNFALKDGMSLETIQRKTGYASPNDVVDLQAAIEALYPE